MSDVRPATDEEVAAARERAERFDRSENYNWMDRARDSAEDVPPLIARIEADTTELIAARERIADLEESRDSWRDSAKATEGEGELQRARKVVEAARVHDQINLLDDGPSACPICAALADYDRVKGRDENLGT